MEAGGWRGTILRKTIHRLWARRGARCFGMVRKTLNEIVLNPHHCSGRVVSVEQGTAARVIVDGQVVDAGLDGAA